MTFYKTVAISHVQCIEVQHVLLTKQKPIRILWQKWDFNKNGRIQKNMIENNLKTAIPNKSICEQIKRIYRMKWKNHPERLDLSHISKKVYTWLSTRRMRTHQVAKENTERSTPLIEAVTSCKSKMWWIKCWIYWISNLF